MSDAIKFPLDDDERLAEPPLLDYFHEEPGDGGVYAITFVPRNTVSAEPTESVHIHKSVAAQQSDAHRIATFLQRIEQLLGSRVMRIAHGGGTNYSFLLPHNVSRTLADLNDQNAHEVFDRLKQIAEVAELAFADMHHPSGR